ncbi:MAG: hypothetical protein GY839_09155 [candidate division Zixibacteria bacterium]|nr:hypothetical protein [candidate division Zixibacteria bacterium]
MFKTDIKRGIVMLGLMAISILPNLNVSAQTPDWNIILHAPTGYNLYLEDLWYLDIINNEIDPLEIYLYGAVDESERGMMFRGRSNPLIVPPGGTTFYPNDIEDVYDTRYDPEFDRFIQRSGRFPAGDYEVCVEVRFIENDEVLGRACYNFVATLPAAPGLISPVDLSIVIENTPLFQWTAPIPLPPEAQVSYMVRICEIRQDQTPLDAINSIAHFEEEIYSATSLLYSVGAQEFEVDKQYAWQIQAVDEDGYPIGENNGKSEIWTFTYGLLLIEVEELVIYPSIVVTTTLDSIYDHRNHPTRPLSLREAILWANYRSRPDTIAFNIPTSDQGYDAQSGVWEFNFNRELPGLTDDETTIDGSLGNAPNGGSDLPGIGACNRPAIGLDGTGLNNGIFVTGDRSIIKGLAIYNSNGPGIRIEGRGNQVLCCYIGTNSNQMAGLGNSAGVALRVSASNNKIGLPDAGNLISGNTNNGILLYGNVRNTSIEGNYIGVKTDGLTKLPNKIGISIENGARTNAVGGAGSRTEGQCDQGCNIISGNNEIGVRISNGDQNTIVGSYIGVGVDGNTAVGNGTDGIVIVGSHGNRVGGGRDNLRNVISGNRDGIVLKRSPARKSVINRIEGNYIGTNDGGTMTVPNIHRGVLLTSASESNMIGGDNDSYGNVISGNNGAGIRLDTNAKYNFIRNNLIGTSRNNLQLPNGQGIALYYSAQENQIGGAVEWGNTIAYNNGDGVHVEGPDCANNSIVSNLIYHNDGKGISLINGAHGDHPWLRIWENIPLGGDEYYIIGQMDTVYTRHKVEIYSDYLNEGRFLEATNIIPDSVRVGWFGTKVRMRGSQFTFLISDSLGQNTSEFLIPPANPSHVGQWPFDMDYWRLDPDNYLPLNPHFHGGWGNMVPKKYTRHVWGVSKLFNSSAVRDVPGFAHRIFFTTGAFCGPFINYQMPVLFTGELYFESYVNQFFDMDSNFGLMTPPGTGVTILTQRYFNPDSSLDRHDRLECPEESYCDFNDWPDDKYGYIKHYLDSTGYAPILTLEIDREESFEDWNSHPYWQDFDGLAGPDSPGFEAVGVLGKYYYQQKVDGKQAIVLGIWTHDGAHGGRTEIHPVFGMAIQEQAPPNNSAGKEVWHFFIRNKGNQSFCGSHVQCTGHPAWAFRIKGRPGPCTIKGLNGYAHEEDDDTVYWSIARSGNDVVINTFIPDEDDWLIGTVEIDWK